MVRFLCYDTALNEEYTLIRLLQRYPRYWSLFAGTDDEQIWDAAPYLFEVDSDFYDLRRESGLIRLDHCMVLETDEPGVAVVQFLQRFIYPETTEDPVYFRIWDPRVLLQAFPAWSEKERMLFFEFFDRFYTEGADGVWLDCWMPDVRYRLSREPVQKAAIFPDNDPVALKDTQTPDEKPEAQTDVINTEAPPKRRRFFIE
ncbi:DUF4123 domain-containing protein [Niabella pedocola]|uniref:DUF4123 domain-containing protein n=1 Tax=Niabella pedocola TaxID=1752077 RepID=A0ABS8PQV2_9BACT|nr:DUF4123 domain-containing protein [Niabella pedocola]MCD2423476.1 DUF4123 domain-containing protein [Niabella pedocola]